jgi:hypothetical protein
MPQSKDHPHGICGGQRALEQGFSQELCFPLLFIIPSMLNTDLSSDVGVVGPFDNAVLRDVVSSYFCKYLN